ncbi:MAG: succinate dehydrogenase iron-sulfur subunit [Simkaniaceae bacterium]
MAKTVIFKIFRGEPENQYWEEFELQLYPFANVISLLMDIQKNPINRKGHKTTPVSWEQGCLEEVCGSCSMLVNGKPKQACSTIVQNIIKATGSNVITLAPFTKYPLVRDLVVDRKRMFENLKKIHGWIDADGTFIKGFGPKIKPKKQDVMYVLSTCMTCGCCQEACPQVNKKSKFVGPAPVSQVRLFNMNPTGEKSKEERLRSMMGEGGISECGNAQNCVQVCPKNIPLTESIAAIGRDVSVRAFKDIFDKPEDD